MRIREILEGYGDYDDDMPSRGELDADAARERFEDSVKEYFMYTDDYVSLEDVLIDEIGDEKGTFWYDPALKDLANDPRYIKKEDLRSFLAMFSVDPVSAIKTLSISVEEYYNDDDNYREWVDGEWEQKNPYASRGLRQSDFN